MLGQQYDLVNDKSTTWLDGCYRLAAETAGESGSSPTVAQARKLALRYDRSWHKAAISRSLVRARLMTAFDALPPSGGSVMLARGGAIIFHCAPALTRTD